MRTVKITDLQKLAATAKSDEVLTVSSGDLFTAPLSTVLRDLATKVSLGNVSTSLGNLRVSLGSYKAEASNLFATKVSLGNTTSGLATQVSLGAVQSQVSLCATTVSLGNVDSRVTALEQASVPVVSLGNLPSISTNGDLAVVEDGGVSLGNTLAYYYNNSWYRASDDARL